MKCFFSLVAKIKKAFSEANGNEKLLVFHFTGFRCRLIILATCVL